VNRRGFLGAVAAALVPGALFGHDPERLLWVPGKKLISVPKPAADGIWLSANLGYPYDRGHALDAAHALMNEWRRREAAANTTIAPISLPHPLGLQRAEEIKLGRFPVRLVEAFDVVNSRMICRLDIASDEARHRGCALPRLYKRVA
jgi:hypothetical protein